MKPETRDAIVDAVNAILDAVERDEDDCTRCGAIMPEGDADGE